MKRKLYLILLALACMVLLAGCKCEHEWVAADCVTPKTCSLCQETDGAPLGHSWIAATCEEARYCEVCAVTDGDPAGHSWVEASCAAPKHCENCDLTEGIALEHTWLNATTEEPKTCSVCGATEGERINVDERFKTQACKEVFGAWQFEMSLPGKELNMGDYVEEVPFLATLTFGEDGTIAVDMGFRDLDQFLADLHAGTVAQMYRQFEDLDMTREEADEAFEDTYGMSVEDYCSAVWAAINWDAVFDIYEVSLVYYVQDGQIYAADSWDAVFTGVPYTISGNTMTITESGLTTELVKVQ